MNENYERPAGRRVWRDPLSLGFEAHRGLLLLRLRLRASAARRRAPVRPRRGPRRNVG